MNAYRLKPWQHLGLSLGLLILLLGAAYLLLARPAWQSRQAFAGRVAEIRLQHERFTNMSARTESLRRTVAGLEQDKSLGHGFITEKKDALAAAELQNRLKNLINEAGGALISTQVIPQDRREDIFPAVGIRVRMRGDMEALRRLLYQIAVGRPVLLADNLLVRKSHAGGHTLRGGGQLEILFDVTGFIYRIGE